jgi:hypothetical protein
VIKFAVRRLAVAGAVLLLFASGHWLAGVVLVFAFGGLYYYSIRSGMDWVPCWLCGGSGTRAHRGLLAWLFGRALGGCLRCHGEKVTLRWGSRMLGRGAG